MKALRVLLCIALFLALPLFTGCNKGASTDATQPLLKAFDKADAESRQAIQSVTENLKSKNYVEVVKTLLPLAERLKLTPEQKEAMALTLKQLNEATKNDPAFDSKEMYDMQNKLFHAVYNNR